MARDVMVQLHWELENHFQHFGQPGFGMLGFDPRRKVDGPPQLLLPYDFDESAKALTRRAYASKSCRKLLGRGMFRFLGKRDPSLGSDGVLAIRFWNRSWTTHLMDLWREYGSAFMTCRTRV
jgi:hypothetical protein